MVRAGAGRAAVAVATAGRGGGSGRCDAGREAGAAVAVATGGRVGETWTAGGLFASAALCRENQAERACSRAVRAPDAAAAEADAAAAVGAVEGEREE
jgi:hypothetical protein